ncbi:hypothetical protein KDA23_06865, partial [Candidatus Saccharibacteria bacterium]|nr:hypothetical protein [Candidatus Saccharibacteria bacterium]
MSKLYRIATSTIAMVFSLSVLTVLGTLNQPVSARQNPQPKVTICHRTDAANNPYVQLSVDKNAVDGFSGNNQGDDHYGEHQGPVAYSTAVAQALKDQHKKWGDIIPPVPGAHNGL